RMSEVTAAIGRVQLQRLEGWLERRRATAKLYTQAFSNLPGIHPPKIRTNTQHAWHQYCILVDEPEALRATLDERGIDSRIYYSQPCHRQSVYTSHPQHHATFPITDSVASRLVALPIHHQLTTSEVQRVIEAVVSGSSISDGIGKRTV
ncbi:DegT/DnrJ/EryC1/StrS family aminotransferase, partial [Poseidonia sp.]